MSEMVEQAARAFMSDALAQMGLTEQDLIRDPTLDGSMKLAGVDVRRAMRAAIAAMRDWTPDMSENPDYLAGAWSRRNIEAFIDAALTDPECPKTP